jgi:hypothetical protein
MAADAVLYADCFVAADADIYIKGFADACYKDEEGITKGIALKGVVLKSVLCYKDKEDKQRRKKVITSLVKVKLRQLRKDTIIISLSLISVFTSLSFV